MYDPEHFVLNEDLAKSLAASNLRLLLAGVNAIDAIALTVLLDSSSLKVLYICSPNLGDDSKSLISQIQREKGSRIDLKYVSVKAAPLDYKSKVHTYLTHVMSNWFKY